MEITSHLIDKLASLAKLEFDSKARGEIMRDMNEMLAFVEKLQEVDTAGVEPLIHLSEDENLLRSDVVSTEITRQEALLNAPVQDTAYFKVPVVVKKNG